MDNNKKANGSAEVKSARMSELNEQELEDVVGGVLDDEAMEWIAKNWDKLCEKSGEYGIEEGNLEEFVQGLQECPFAFNLKGLKEYLKTLKDMQQHRA